MNFSPPFDQVKWFELHNIIIDNGGHLFGDEVGAVGPWTHPGVADNLTADKIKEIKSAVAEGHWREDVRADMWIGKLIGQILGLTAKEKIKSVVKRLLEVGIIKLVPGVDDNRRERMFVTVGDGPAPVQATGAGFEDPL